MDAIEAIATFDHYHFRKVMQRASKPQPLRLWYPGKPDAPVPWWKEYYDRTKIQMRDRCLFAKAPLPPGVATIKTVDWKSVDAATAPEKRATAKKASTKDTIAKKVTTKKAKTKKAAAKKLRRRGKSFRKKCGKETSTPPVDPLSGGSLS